MLRTALLMILAFVLLAPCAMAQPAAASPGGGETNVSVTAPGDKSMVKMEFNNKITACEGVFVNGRELSESEYEWHMPGTGKKTLEITFDGAPPKGTVIEVRVSYPKAKPDLSGSSWS